MPVLAATGTVLALVVVGTPTPTASAAPRLPAEAFDFNGDGYADLAVAVPGEDIGSVQDAGAVNVIYGSGVGLTATGDQFWSQDTPGVPGGAETGDLLGGNASGDFNSDGYADLAVAVPGEAVGDVPAAGAVNVLHGSPSGLTVTGSRFISQATAGVPGGAEPHDGNGLTLAVGDFDGDLHADLAIGAQREDIGSNGAPSGAVTVLHGSPSGLQTSGAQLWWPQRLGRSDSYFGTGLHAGDVTGDGRDDLIVFSDSGGLVSLLPGGVEGLTAVGVQHWRVTDTDLPDVMAVADQLSGPLALGDFDGDRHDDLALGAPFADASDREDDECDLEQHCDGAFTVLYGSAAGLENREGRQVWHAGNSGLPALGSSYDMGRSLAAGDLNGDGAADLAVGIDDGLDTGHVLAMYGARGAGLTAFASQFFGQGRGVSGANEQEDRFGASLRIAQFGASDHADLAVAIPGESLGRLQRAGRVALLYGSSSGLTATGQQSWSQDGPGIRGVAEPGDHFG